MKARFFIVLTLVLAALAANFLLQENGYVLINARGYAIEMSVPVLLLLLLLGYVAVRMLVRLWQAPRQLGEMAARRRQRKATERMLLGYIEMSEGNFRRGEKLLTRAAENSEAPLLHYLAAARVAQAQGDTGKRDNWLKLASEHEPRATVAVLLTQAELQLAGNELAAARATLQELLVRNPRNAEALRLSAELSLASNDWQQLEALLPQLAKTGRIANDRLNDWYERTWSALLGDPNADVERIQQLWKSLPKPLRGNPQLVGARAAALVKRGQAAEAETILRKELNRQWNEELVLLYGELDMPDHAAMLRQVERWLQDRPNDPALLLSAGRLCVRNQLWGKARTYFESSLAIKPSPIAWHELGQLLVQMGEAPAASAAFQKGLRLISHGNSDVPRLAARISERH